MMRCCEQCGEAVRLRVAGRPVWYVERSDDDHDVAGAFCSLSCLYEWVRGVSDRGRNPEPDVPPWKPWRPM